ncbi:MAG: DUF4129 domain-containing protein [Chloroflexia bacterium]|nr:DUF4129 domain-containing protein [Chloroflexia bacterium]
MIPNDSLASDSRKGARDRDRALRKQSIKSSWPTVIMIPVLVGVLHACTFSLLIELFLGETFGLSAGHPAPWPGAIALIFLASFWLNRAIGRLNRSTVVSQIVTFACWLATYLAWLLLEPAYRDTDVWTQPGQLVQSEAFLIPPLLISMAVWWVGMNYASDIANISAEEIRMTVQRDWIVLFGSILLAAMIGGAAGDSALAAARFAAPLLLIASLALVAGAELESTRKLAIRRGGQPPGWGRWARLVGGLAAGVLLLTLLVLVILSPEALGAIVGGIAAAARAVGWVLAYVLFAVVWTLYQVAVFVTRIIEWIFGDIFGPLSPPEMPAQQPAEMEPIVMEDREVGQWEYAILLRWVALFIAVAVVAIILFRITRKSQAADDDGAVDEHRDSVFSADLAKQQLRDLFRRRQREAKPPRLDLDRPPESVRETMVYLETLAARQGVGRRKAETPDDFAARLRAMWSGVGTALVDFPRRYEHIRYGEEPDGPGSPDRERALADWTQIWNARKHVEPPKDDG